VKRFEEDIRAGLTFFGRPHRFAREGETAARLLGLTRDAFALGLNERRVYDVDGLRALRERVALSPAREELVEGIESLYRAQVAERNVAQAGFEIVHHSDDIDGVVETTYRGFLGVPWRPRWPFGTGGSVVDFFRFDYAHLRRRYVPGLATTSHLLSVEVALNRETSVRLRWLEPGSTATEIAKLIDPPRRVDFEVVYAFGR
jgi:hypothetical protein